MARINYNKHVANPSEVNASVFSSEEQLRYGEIVLCNSIDEPGIYIFTKNDGGETRIQKVNSVENIVLDANIDPSESGVVASGDSLTTIVSKLQNQINELSLSGDTGTTKVNNIVAGVGLNPDGTYSAIAGDYIATATSIADAIQLLDSAITEVAATTLQDAKDYADAKIEEAVQSLDNEETAGDGEVFVKITEVDGIVSGDVKGLSVVKDASGLKYDLKLGDYVYGSIDIPQDQFLEEVIFISAATVQDVAEALNYGQVIELGKPYLKFIWRLPEGLLPTYVDVSGLIDIYTAEDVKLSDSYTGTSFNIHSGTSLEDAVGHMTTELTSIEERVQANEISSPEKTINVTTSDSGTSIDVNIDNDTIVKNETVASQGQLSVELSVDKQHIDSGYVRTQYTLKSKTGEYGVINDTRDVVVGDVDEYINVTTEPVSDAQGNRTDKITITPTIQRNISEATSENIEDGNGLVTAWGVKTYIKDGMDGDDIMVGDDNLLQYHPIEFWRGKINFDPQSIFYDTVHEAFFKTDNNMELLDNSLGFDSDGQQVHQYPSARTQDTLLIKDDRTVMDALKTLDKAIDEMDYSADTEENKVFTGITQTNGHVAVTSENLTNRKLAGYEVANVPNPSGATYKVAATDKLGQALGKLQGQINAMDWTGATNENQVFTGITEKDGLVSATCKNIANVKLADYQVVAVSKPSDAAAKVAATDTLGQGLGKLQGQINAMDWTGSTTENEVFTGITENDGLISATTKLLTNVKLSGYTVGADTSGKVAATDTLGEALGKLQGQINGLDWTGTTNSDQVFTGITEKDGKVSAATALTTSRTLSGYTVENITDNTLAVSKVAATDTLGKALGKLQGQINSMDYTATTTSDQIFTGFTEADGEVTMQTANVTTRTLAGYSTTADTKVAATQTLGVALGNLQGQIDAMDYSANTGTDKVITGITQSDGKISVTSENITSRIITGYAVGSDAKVAATDSLGGALGKLQGQINGLDYTATTTDNEVFTKYEELDGKPTITKGLLASRKLSGYTLGADAKIAATDTLGGALGKLQGQINNLTKAASSETGKFVRTVTEVSGKVTETKGYILDSDVKIVSASPETTNIKESWKLINGNNVQLGSTINIYKDSSLKSVVLSGDSSTVGQWLVFTYILEDGSESKVAVDVSKFLVQAEFQSGVTATNEGIVKGVVDGNSEKNESNVHFLTVGADGFKISGIKDAIDTKINKLDSSAATTNAGYYMTGIGIADGKITGITQSQLTAQETKLSTGGTITGNVLTSLTVSDHTITLGSKNVPDVAWKRITAGGTNIDAATSADTISVVTGNSAITLVGDATNKKITISHTDTSSQASVDAGAGKFIKSVGLDTYGHVSGLTTSDTINSATTAADSAKVAGKTVGNDSGNVPLSNGTVNTDLNADKVDGKHVWSGTQTQYNAITSKDPNTIYIIV